MQTEESKQRMKNSIGRAFLVLLAVLLQVIWIVGFAIKLTQYYAYISTAVSVLALIIAMRIYGEHINSAYKFSWIIVIMAFPILGLCLFLLFGREGASLLMKKRLYAVEQNLGQYLPDNEVVLDKLRQDNLAIGNQAYYIQYSGGYPVYQNTDIAYYGDTTEALTELKAELRKAEAFIFMEYHAIEDSTAWAGIEVILKEKAAQGVDVRVFYDDMGSIGF